MSSILKAPGNFYSNSFLSVTGDVIFSIPSSGPRASQILLEARL